MNDYYNDGNNEDKNESDNSNNNTYIIHILCTYCIFHHFIILKKNLEIHQFTKKIDLLISQLIYQYINVLISQSTKQSIYQYINPSISNGNNLTYPYFRLHLLLQTWHVTCWSCFCGSLIFDEFPAEEIPPPHQLLLPLLHLQLFLNEVNKYVNRKCKINKTPYVIIQYILMYSYINIQYLSSYR